MRLSALFLRVCLSYGFACICWIFFSFFCLFCLPVRCSLLYSTCVFFFCFLLSVCPSVGLPVCLCLSLSVLIYLCLSVRLPNLSHVSVFHAPSHICHALPPNTQCGRPRGVCLFVVGPYFLYLYCFFYLSPCSLLRLLASVCLSPVSLFIALTHAESFSID